MSLSKPLKWISLMGLLSGCMFSMTEWGNHIDFVNELAYDIDSLAFTVCDSTSMLYVNKNMDGKTWIDDMPYFPESGYPCPVEIRVYAGKKIKDLIASPFDCYHCDNSKYYILRGDSAVFETHYRVE